MTVLGVLGNAAHGGFATVNRVLLTNHRRYPL